MKFNNVCVSPANQWTQSPVINLLLPFNRPSVESIFQVGVGRQLSFRYLEGHPWCHLIFIMSNQSLVIFSGPGSQLGGQYFQKIHESLFFYASGEDRERSRNQAAPSGESQSLSCEPQISPTFLSSNPGDTRDSQWNSLQSLPLHREFSASIPSPSISQEVSLPWSPQSPHLTSLGFIPEFIAFSFYSPLFGWQQGATNRSHSTTS